MYRLLSALFTAAVIAGIALAWGYRTFRSPGPLVADKIVMIERGSGLDAIADTLETEGVIEDGWLFVAGVRLADKAQDLKAGEYEIPAAASPREVMDLLLKGRTVVHRITIVEGTTVRSALTAIKGNDVLSGDISDPPEEGMMLPETYHFDRGEDRQRLVDRATAAIEFALEELWPERREGLPLQDPDEAIILASIVEKETALPAERPRVAAVFVNRLTIGMRLQADPTVVYGLSDGSGSIDRPLTRADLETPNPYNTYLNAGLPPGPIALPSRASIEAVLRPADTKELYFVADGSGGHVFAETLAEHNRNVARWRRHQRNQGE